MALPPYYVNFAFQALWHVVNLRAEARQVFGEIILTSASDEQHSSCPVLDSFYDSIGSDRIHERTYYTHTEIKSMFEIFPAESQQTWNPA